VDGARPSTAKMVTEYRTANDDKHKALIFEQTAQKCSCYSSFAQSTLLCDCCACFNISAYNLRKDLKRVYWSGCGICTFYFGSYHYNTITKM